MSIPESPNTPVPQAFEAVCAAAVNCDHCFKAGYVQRPYIDIAQPRYVGPDYWSADRRFLFLMINPGGANGSWADQQMRKEILQFRSGELGLAELFKLQRAHIAEWGGGKFLRYFNSIGCDLREVALLNVAWCATKHDSYPDKLLGQCFSSHTLPAIQALRPTAIVACGVQAQKFLNKAGLRSIAVPHYAARTSIDFDAIRTLLQTSKLNPTPSLAPTVSTARNPSQLESRGQDVIRLLEPTNPKTGKSRARYACYTDKMTVADYTQTVRMRRGEFESRKCNADLKWDTERKFISIERARV